MPAFLVLLSLSACQRTEPAELLFVDGTVHVDRTTTATAMAVRGGVVVGLDDAALDLEGKDTTRVSLGGGHVFPGWHDAHVHLLAGNFALQRLMLLGVSSMEAMAGEVADYAAENPDEPWIVGYGWLGETIDDPSGAPIDAVVSDRPVLLISSSGHAAIVNRKALELAGIDASTPDPEDGEIARDPETGEPTGYLLEGAIALVSDVVVAAYDDAAMGEGLADRLEVFSESGLTGVSEILAVPGISLVRPQLYADLEARGELPLRVTWYVPIFDADDVAGAVAVRDAHEDGTLVRFGGGKVWVDGSMGTVEAWTSEPYEGTTDDYGTHYFDEAALVAIVGEAEDVGLSIRFHANGDAAIAAVLDALEAVSAERGGLGQRYTIEHAVLADADDMARMAQLGIPASVQPAHYLPASLGDTADALGERFDDAYAFGVLADAGVTLAMGTDWPVWPEQSPLITAMNAVNRDEDDALTAIEALHAYAEGGGAVIAREDELGRLDVGYLADFVVLGADPAAVAATELPDVPIEQVWVGGVRVR